MASFLIVAPSGVHEALIGIAPFRARLCDLRLHDYLPDFLIRLKTWSPCHLILETKGYDPLEEVKKAAAERWIAAVNAEGSCGTLLYSIAK
jgi:hypothetical protein